jgi:hypothetical protein
MNYWRKAALSIDQTINALAGGNPDVSLSAHIGYMSMQGKTRWWCIERVVNYTFKPLDGEGHCADSVLADSDIDDTDNFIATTIAAFIGCVIVFVPVRIFACIR